MTASICLDCRLDEVRIAVVEDDREWREMVVAEVEAQGALALGLGSVEALYRELAVGFVCDMIVLDVNLPGEDGIEAITHLRRVGGMGIVLLSGRGSDADMARGLSRGADLYLVKPISLAVLACALSSLYRRMTMLAVAGSSSRDAVIRPIQTLNGWSLRSDGWDIHAPNGKSLALTMPERGFLRALFNSPGIAVHRERLILAVSRRPDEFDPHRLDVLVNRLRARVNQIIGLPLPVRAMRSVGYFFVANE